MCVDRSCVFMVCAEIRAGFTVSNDSCVYGICCLVCVARSCVLQCVWKFLQVFYSVKYPVLLEHVDWCVVDDRSCAMYGVCRNSCRSTRRWSTWCWFWSSSCCSGTWTRCSLAASALTVSLCWPSAFCRWAGLRTASSSLSALLGHFGGQVLQITLWGLVFTSVSKFPPQM